MSFPDDDVTAPNLYEMEISRRATTYLVAGSHEAGPEYGWFSAPRCKFYTGEDERDTAREVLPPRSSHAREGEDDGTRRGVPPPRRRHAHGLFTEGVMPVR